MKVAFSHWLSERSDALQHDSDVPVPCGTCTACCTSAQFVHIEPDEVETLARVPEALRVPAPEKPGHFVIGYDEHGHCPMLEGGRCSIYAHRPRTCKRYDCRVFAAAGLRPDKPDIEKAARRFELTHPVEHDRHAHEAVQRAAAFVQEQTELNPTQLAGLALRIHALWLVDGSTDEERTSALRRELEA